MMKKLFFAFFLIFTLFLPLSAQVRLGNFSQKGVATQEMKDDGLVAAHSSLPLNTVLKVKNEANSKEVDVKIINRIANSPSRVIDLSAAAFKAIELKKGGIVTISVNAAVASVASGTQTSGASTSKVTMVNGGNGQTDSAPGVVVVQPNASQPYSIPVQTTTAPGTTVTSSQLPGINVVVTNSTPIATPTAPAYPPTYTPSYPQPYSRGEPYNGDRIIVINTNPSPGPVYYPPPASAPVQTYAPAPTSASAPAPTSASAPAPTSASAPVSAPAPAAPAPQKNNGAYLAWMMAMTIEAREARAAREEREIREAREAREMREMRIAREEREAREIREAREEREAREAREARAAQIAREEREAREFREAMEEL